MSIRVGRYLIYGLIDPRDRGLRYIGKTHKRKEARLDEHIKCAVDGDSRVVYDWIRELIQKGFKPEIFVLKKIDPDLCWREAEREAIAFWQDDSATNFPYIHPPQTIKSSETLILYVNLLNATKGG